MRWSVLFLMLISPSTLTPNVKPQFIVWDVGQGQFATLVDVNACFHFDMGGEFFPSSDLRKFCRTRTNHAFFSHWDWDHINFARRALRALANLCIARMPGGETDSPQKRGLFSMIPNCERHILTHSIREIGKVAEPPVAKLKKLRSNQLSRVYEYKGILIPGDSTSAEEKHWAKKVNPSVKILLLGHHGSRTSSSKRLISQLAQLRTAIASARRKRYGHPHIEVVHRLKSQGIAVVRTEEWGNLHFELR